MDQISLNENCYEYDAPSHVISFKSPDGNSTPDRWFDAQASGDRHMLTPLFKKTPLQELHATNLPLAVVCPSVKGDAEPAPSVPSPPPNIVTSWGNAGPTRVPAQPKRKTTAQTPVKQLRLSKRKAANEDPSAVRDTPPDKKVKTEPATRMNQSAGSARRSRQRSTKTISKERAAVAPAANNKRQKTSEEQELDRIRDLQKVVVEHRKKNEASYKAAMAGAQPQKKLSLQTTVPKEFNFSTDSRVKPPAEAARKEVDFVGQLRKHTSPARAPAGSTVPKPFNLSTSNKRRGNEEAAYVPMAQQVEQFLRRTPDRYHLRSRQTKDRGPSPMKGKKLEITEPHTPQLMTRQRARPVTVKSTAELEAEELEKIHKYKFKALELDRKILEAALNPKKPAVKEATKSEAFQLQIEKRLQERNASKKTDEEKQPAFHSQPIPTKILEGVVGVPEKKVYHPTVPESPAFALKKRIRMERKVEEVKPPSPIKARPAPHHGLPFQLHLPEKSQVEVCPFSFEEREQERRALKEKKLEEMRNEEVPKFKAQLLPDFHEVVLPQKVVVGPTKPKPFKLRIDERGAHRSDQWDEMMKKEQKQMAEAAVFKARPNTVTTKEPFQPKKESRSMMEAINRSLVPEAFQLSTERRAKERQEFEKQVSENQALRAHLQEQQQREQEEREKEEVAKMRREQVHKAQSVRHYKPVEVKKSDVALTVPQSPNFSKRFNL